MKLAKSFFTLPSEDSLRLFLRKELDLSIIRADIFSPLPSKAGINGFTKSIALELGSRNIRCNAIAPGFIETDMTSQGDGKLLESWIESIPLKRAGSVDDVANLCSYLASDEASYITGQIIKVDGGLVT